MLRWLIAISLLALVAVGGLRIDRKIYDRFVTDDRGVQITTELGRPILIGHEHRWDLIVDDLRIPLARWMDDSP